MISEVDMDIIVIGIVFTLLWALRVGANYLMDALVPEAV